jgi:[glutamine synthetase] adenylyltransferase / [glutamine synthetase]-adenylyl-L-tyrosine phosphorylase
VSRDRVAGLEGRLARLGFVDVPAVARDWADVGVGSEQLLESLAAAADPDLAVRSLARLVAAAGEHGPQLQRLLGDDPEFGRRLTRVLGASAALADHLARHPEDCLELADAGLDLVRPTASAIVAAMAKARDRDDLRRIYRRHLLLLAARDLGLQLRVEDCAAELADLAAGALQAAMGLARAELGASVDCCTLSIVGMGKCGGRELNYVSDVDVIFVAEPRDGADEQVALKAATSWAALTMKICGDHTREGTLWPVDAGLRPEGRSGPLVRTLESHASYYRRWAKTWEFQALLKARPIAGDRELGERYMATVTPMVWEASSRADFVSDVQAMRQRVVEHIPPGEADRELKLGRGGLRDVEFAVQLLQLVHGRGDPSLRAPNTISALEALVRGGYVGRQDGAAMLEAYRFLRTLEHRLQLSHLRRTHLLPNDDASLRVLGRSVGMTHEPVRTLTDEWRRHVREVRRLHEKLFYRPLLAAVAALPDDDARLTPEAARLRLEALGYADPVAALRHLEALTAGVSRRAAIQRTLLPAMLGWFAAAPDPDAGLLGFRQLSDALGKTPWYLRLLRDEGAAAERLAHLLATSRYATELLMRAPEATAMLADDDELRPRDEESLVREAVVGAQRHADAEDAIRAVRALRRRELFRIAAGDIFGLLDVAEVGRALTSVARATIEGALVAATAAVERESGRPIATTMAVIAMGRLGGCEMSYASDADVLFVHRPHPGVDEQEASEDAFAVANELRRLLSLPGPDPTFAVDANLRPEGRQGPLVRTLASYQAYYTRWSKVWEAQAMLRAAPIAGDRRLGDDFVAIVDRLRYAASGLSAADVAEIRRIKARVDSERLPRGADPSTHLKLGRGGLADVEWTAQLLQMRYAGAHPGLQTTQTLQALDAAVAAGLLNDDSREALRRAWSLASRIRNAAMLVRGRPSDSLPTVPRDRVGVAFLCGYDRVEASRLDDDYRRIARRASVAVDEVFWN